MTASSTLADIRSKVRRLTGRPSPEDLSNAEIDKYINTYYQYDFPESLRLLKLKDTFTFSTIPNVEVYPFNDTLYVTIEPPAYCRGQEIQYFQDISMFYRQWPKDNFIQQAAIGDGTSGPYVGQLTGTPFMRSINPTSDTTATIGKDIRVMFSVNTTGASASPPSANSAYDDGNGGFIDSITGLALTGIINYNTGVFAITFSGPVPSGAQINATTIPYVASAPRTMCMYQNQIFLRPIPDKAYIVEVNAFRYPSQLLNDTDDPELNFWWQLLAFGAARKILVDNADFESIANFEPYFLEQLRLVQRRTIKQQTNQRAQTIYSQSGGFPFSNLYPYI